MTNFVAETQKMFLGNIRNIYCIRYTYPSLATLGDMSTAYNWTNFLKEERPSALIMSTLKIPSKTPLSLAPFQQTSVWAFYRRFFLFIFLTIRQKRIQQMWPQLSKQLHSAHV